ncbi:hypothetical protein, partial [Mesorhizobium sp.]|uniref:hypothetical protein n=1 Tax=Mesorhizobium sp. TaxID=1871066 RepID=UPI0025B7F6A9
GEHVEPALQIGRHDVEAVPILNRCAGGDGPVVGDDCSFLVDVMVTESCGYVTLSARRFLPLQ